MKKYSLLFGIWQYSVQSTSVERIELEITAHAFEERIDKQDEICLNVRRFVKAKLDIKEVRVWLLLPQLGHSWEQ